MRRISSQGRWNSGSSLGNQTLSFRIKPEMWWSCSYSDRSLGMSGQAQRNSCHTEVMQWESIKNKSQLNAQHSCFISGEVLASNPGQKLVILSLFILFISHSNRCHEGTGNYNMTISFHILYNSIFTNHPMIQCHIVSATENIITQTMSKQKAERGLALVSEVQYFLNPFLCPWSS